MNRPLSMVWRGLIVISMRHVLVECIGSNRERMYKLLQLLQLFKTSLPLSCMFSGSQRTQAKMSTEEEVLARQPSSMHGSKHSVG